MFDKRFPTLLTITVTLDVIRVRARVRKFYYNITQTPCTKINESQQTTYIYILKGETYYCIAIFIYIVDAGGAGRGSRRFAWLSFCFSVCFSRNRAISLPELVDAGGGAAWRTEIVDEMEIVRVNMEMKT